jgi:ketosteroid isomerase-like protein
MFNKTLILIVFVVVVMCLSMWSQAGTQQPSTGTSQSQTGTQQPSTGTSQSQTGMQQPGMSQSGGSAEQQIRALEEQARQAALRNDPSFLDQHATDDYVAITSTGDNMTKTQMVQAMRSGAIRYQSIEPRNLTVRTFGDTAIVNGEATLSMTRNGQPVAGNFRFTRVWVRQGGDWKIASFESTPEQQTK